MNGFLIQSQPLTVQQHMALDEALALAMPKSEEQFFLRFYNWGGVNNAMTFGYAQFWADIEREAEAKNFTGPMVRRPTGGGVVYHNGDLTFSCIFTSPLRRAQELYDKLHGAINNKINLSMAGKSDAGMYAPSLNGAANACFANPVESDIVDAQGRKILGGAIRRFDNVILYQGSLQDAGARDNEDLQDKIKQAVAREWGFIFAPYSITPQLNARMEEESKKYLTDEWNQKF
ncbi:lipoate-protein ligase A [Elusimicrobium simillimum]|uniref:lipoate--protein ligase family protein n=1 Tax=Elusimicrobium simillimum TaxID=3143438 RepID=UPI003C6FDB7B